MLGKQAWQGMKPGPTLDSWQSLTLAAEPWRANILPTATGSENPEHH